MALRALASEIQSSLGLVLTVASESAATPVGEARDHAHALVPRQTVKLGPIKVWGIEIGPIEVNWPLGIGPWVSPLLWPWA